MTNQLLNGNLCNANFYKDLEQERIVRKLIGYRIGDKQITRKCHKFDQILSPYHVVSQFSHPDFPEFLL